MNGTGGNEIMRSLWQWLVRIILLPGEIVARFFPELRGEALRFTKHMANYIFWFSLVMIVLIVITVDHPEWFVPSEHGG